MFTVYPYHSLNMHNFECELLKAMPGCRKKLQLNCFERECAVSVLSIRFYTCAKFMFSILFLLPHVDAICLPILVMEWQVMFVSSMASKYLPLLHSCVFVLPFEPVLFFIRLLFLLVCIDYYLYFCRNFSWKDLNRPSISFSFSGWGRIVVRK